MLLRCFLRWFAIAAALCLLPMIAMAQAGIESSDTALSARNDARSLVLTELNSLREMVIGNRATADWHDPARAGLTASNSGDLPLCSPMEVVLAAARAAVLTVACREPNGDCGSVTAGAAPARCAIAEGKLP